MNDICLLPATGSSSLIPIALIATTLVASGVLLRRWVTRGVGIAAVVAALAVAGLTAAPAAAAGDDCPPATTAAPAAPSSSVAPGTTVAATTPSSTVPTGSSSTTTPSDTSSTTPPEETSTTTEAPPSSPLRPYTGVFCTTRLDGPGGEPREDWRFEIENGHGSGMLYQSTDGSCTEVFEEDEPFTVVVAADPGDPDAACQFVGLREGRVLTADYTFSPSIPSDFVTCPGNA